MMLIKTVLVYIDFLLLILLFLILYLKTISIFFYFFTLFSSFKEASSSSFNNNISCKYINYQQLTVIKQYLQSNFTLTVKIQQTLQIKTVKVIVYTASIQIIFNCNFLIVLTEIIKTFLYSCNIEVIIKHYFLLSKYCSQFYIYI